MKSSDVKKTPKRVEMRFQFHWNVGSIVQRNNSPENTRGPKNRSSREKMKLKDPSVRLHSNRSKIAKVIWMLNRHHNHKLAVQRTEQWYQARLLRWRVRREALQTSIAAKSPGKRSRLKKKKNKVLVKQKQIQRSYPEYGVWRVVVSRSPDIQK
jgi:hypothetical protein